MRHPDIETILADEETLDRITTVLSAKIDADHRDLERPLVLICILKGAVQIFAALVKKIRRPVEMEFMRVSSYGKRTTSSGHIELLLDLDRDDYGDSDFLIVEDIVDSGRTLTRLTALLRERGAKSVKTCTLLDKPTKREVPFDPDYVGMTIPDKFVVGYGLDYDERYRDLPYVGILRPEIYTDRSGKN